MPRTEKGTRIRYLPPAVQLDNKDTEGNVVPTKHRTASDNRTGQTPIWFDDTMAVDFNQPTDNLSLPAGLISGSQYLTLELATNIYTSGSERRGIGDAFVVIPEQKDNLKAFDDSIQPALDNQTSNPFYATGSALEDIGEGFTTPLWSKTKLEIDLTPAESHSFYIENFTSGTNNFPMAYWNKDRRVWEGIGLGVEFGNFIDPAYPGPTLSNMLNYLTLGFAASMMQGYSDEYIVHGVPINNYGFPSSPKFVATASNFIAMKDLISEPFLLEKAVLEFSGTLLQNDYYNADFITHSLTTFFILNERQPYNVTGSRTTEYVDMASVTTSSVTNLDVLDQNSIRDLVTWMQITAVAAEVPGYTELASRELVIPYAPRGEWSGRYVVSGVVKSPIAYNRGNSLKWSTNNDLVYLDTYGHSGRNGMAVPNGRDYVTTFGSPEPKSFVTGARIPFTVYKKYALTNPYILLPTDNLVFGWQLPYDADSLNVDFLLADIYPGKGPELTFNTGQAKLVLYGSLIREGKEYHDTLNQELTSNSIHEDIG